MKLILVRHGETKEGKNGIILGRLGGNLSAKGILEAKEISEKIKEMKFKNSYIISSDLKRAKDTAKIISKETGLQIEFDELLREQGAGIAEGKKDDDINWDLYEKISLGKRKHENGESFIDVKNRAKKFIKKIENANDRDDVFIIVSHSAFLLMLISFVCKIPIKKALKISFRNKMYLIELKKGVNCAPIAISYIQSQKEV